MSLHIYISCYSRLHYAANAGTAHENTDPKMIYQLVASKNNTSVAVKIVEQVWDAPRMLLDAFEMVLTMEAVLQVEVGVHLG